MSANGASRWQADRNESDIQQHIGHAEWVVLSALLGSALRVVSGFVPSASATITLDNGDGTSVTLEVTDDGAELLEQPQGADAAPLPHGAALSIPLRSREKTYGALNVYTTRCQPMSDNELECVQTLADHVANAVALIDASTLNVQLQEAISTRQLIGEAKGILMESERCTRDEAFDILRRASQRANRKVRDMALEIVDAAERRATRVAATEPPVPIPESCR